MHMLPIPKPQYSVQHWSKFQCQLMSRISPEINSLILRQSQFLWENPWEAALTMARALRWLRATMACGRHSLSSAVLWEWLEMWSTMANHVATPVVDLFCSVRTLPLWPWGEATSAPQGSPLPDNGARSRSRGVLPDHKKPYCMRMFCPQRLWPEGTIRVSAGQLFSGMLEDKDLQMRWNQ